MRKEEFRTWLETAGYDSRTVRSRISNCEKICSCEGDIDTHYDEDRCRALLERFEYTTDDESNDRPTRHSVPISGNKRNGTLTLKSALNLYIKFCRGDAHEVRPIDRAAAGVSRSWPEWAMPAEEECYAFAKVTTKYLKFLSPEIVAAVVRDNEENRNLFCEFLREAGVDPDLYLWERSSCCFPGIRRYAGSSEISAYRGRSSIESIEDAVGLDDNDCPKQLWSFVFRGSQFSKFGPKGYSLAHLVDHKKDDNRMATEFEFATGHEFQKPFYGLYTCPSNTVYTPANVIKLTDFNGYIRNLLFRKAKSLYGDVCNIVPTYIKVRENNDPRWNLAEFEWSGPVGTMENVGAFLSFRKNKIEKMLEKFHQKG